MPTFDPRPEEGCRPEGPTREALDRKIAEVLELANSCDGSELDHLTRLQIQQLVTLIAASSRGKRTS